MRDTSALGLLVLAADEVERREKLRADTRRSMDPINQQHAGDAQQQAQGQALMHEGVGDVVPGAEKREVAAFAVAAEAAALSAAPMQQPAAPATPNQQRSSAPATSAAPAPPAAAAAAHAVATGTPRGPTVSVWR